MTTIARPLPTALLLGAALLFTLFLFFIDEGRYSLEGLLTGGHMIAIAIYFIGLVLGLFIMARVFATLAAGPGRTALILCLGTALGFVLGLILILGSGFVWSLVA